MNIRLENAAQKLERLLKSKPAHFLGLPIWCLEVTNKTGYTSYIRIDAKDEEEAKTWATIIARRIEKEIGQDQVSDAFLYQSHLFQSFTDNAKDYLYGLYA